MEDVEIADVVAKEDMVGKDLEEIDGGNLLLVLRAVVKDYVFAVNRELED